jgi:gas vesicle protein
MSESNNTGAFLTGFVLGGLVGAVAALLMTPQAGEKTRLQIQERGAGLKTQLDDLTVEARGRAEKLTTEIQERGKIILEERLHTGGTTSELPSDEKEPAEASSEEEDEVAADAAA